MVGHQLLFAIGLARRGHGLSGNIFSAIKLHILMISGGQGTDLVDHIHQLGQGHQLESTEGHSELSGHTSKHAEEIHLADAIEAMVARRNSSLSTDRAAKNPY